MGVGIAGIEEQLDYGQPANQQHTNMYHVKPIVYKKPIRSTSTSGFYKNYPINMDVTYSTTPTRHSVPKTAESAGFQIAYNQMHSVKSPTIGSILKVVSSQDLILHE